MTERDEKNRKDRSQLVQQAITLSAGEDRIWSLPEQRAFLDNLSLKERVLAENAGLYFIPHNRMPPGVDVYSGVTADKKAGRINPDNYLGNVDYSIFEDYTLRKIAQTVPIGAK